MIHGWRAKSAGNKIRLILYVGACQYMPSQRQTVKQVKQLSSSSVSFPVRLPGSVGRYQNFVPRVRYLHRYRDTTEYRDN